MEPIKERSFIEATSRLLQRGLLEMRRSRFLRPLETDRWHCRWQRENNKVTNEAMNGSFVSLEQRF